MKVLSINIPNSVTSIGQQAFSDCINLTSITLSDNLKNIEYRAFSYCVNLENIELPNSVVSIDDYAFDQCESLTSLTIPDNVTSLGNLAFSTCINIAQISVSSVNPVYDSRNDCNAIIEIETNTLVLGCQNTIIPDNITSIGYGAFYGCRNLTSIAIPDSVTIIGASAFNDCRSLTSIEIPKGIVNIETYTFSLCSNLTSIIIPDSVIKVEKDAFYGCSALTDVYYSGSEDQWIQIKIGTSNEHLKDAEIHYNYNGEQQGNVPIIVIPGVMGSELYDYVSHINNGNVYHTWPKIWVNDSLVIDDAPVSALLSEYGPNFAKESVGVATQPKKEYVIPYEEEISSGNGLDKVISAALFKEADTAVERKSNSEYGTLDTYEVLIESVCEEFPNRDVYFYAYDWRKSNITSAEHLYSLMKDANIEKADILAHSMGGLVLSQFVEQGHEGMISHSITFGTPYEGANKLLNAVLTTETTGTVLDFLMVLDGLDINIKKQFAGVTELSPTEAFISYEDGAYSDYMFTEELGELSADKTQKIYFSKKQFDPIFQPEFMLQGSSGVYRISKEKLNKILFQNYDVESTFQTWLGKIRNAQKDPKELKVLKSIVIESVGTSADSGYWFYPEFEYYKKDDFYVGDYSNLMQRVFGDEQYSNIKEAQNKARAGYQKLLSMDNAYFAVGKNKWTMTGISLQKKKDGTIEFVDCVPNKDGDGTVPFYSANRLNPVENAHNTSYYKLTHGGLVGDEEEKNDEYSTEWPKVRWLMSQILKGTFDSDKSSVSELFNAEEDEFDTGVKTLRFEGNVKVTIRSGEGYLSNSEDAFCNTASFGCMDILGATGNILVFGIEKGIEYTISCTALDEGVVDFTEKLFEDGEVTSSFNYPAIIVEKDSEITIQDNENTPIISIDYEKDGTSDLIIDSTVVEYNISSTYSEGGIVGPNENYYVSEGADTSLTIAADEDYCISYILINGEMYSEAAVNGLTEYTLSFENVNDNYNIYVQFGKIGEPDLTDIGDVLLEDVPADGIIPEGVWVAGIRNQVYTGSAIKQSFRVYDGKTLLKEKSDYTVTYKNTTKAYHVEDPDNPTATDKKKAPQIIIKSNSKGNYKGTKTIYFSIEPLDINDEQITVDELSVQSGTKSVSPVPVVYFNGKKLKNKTDFTVDYNGWNQMDSGDITIKIHGKGNFQGTREVIVHVASSDLISVAKLNVTSKTLKYADLNGDDFLNEIASAVTVKNGKKAVPADGYHFEDIPEDYKKTGTVKFTLVGNEAAGFYGKKTVTVKITGIALSDKKIKTAVPSYEYTGEPQVLGNDFSIKYSDELLEAGKDYTVESYSNNVNAGTATVVLKGLGNYTGTRKVTFKITPVDATGREIHVEDAYYTKGGSKPKVTVEGLSEGTDYTLKYADNKKVTDESVSKYPTVTITFKGNYKGTVRRDFFIDPKPLDLVTITAKDKVYSAKANVWKSAPLLKDTDGKALKAGTDYDKNITYTTADGKELPAVVEPGTVIKVTVTGRGNYTGETSTTYSILETGKDISKMTFKINDKEYTGSAVTIAEADILSIKNGKNELDLKLGTDYEIVSYTNNIKKGTAKVTFRGKGEYGGEKTVSFKIGQRSIVDYWQGLKNFFSNLF